MANTDIRVEIMGSGFKHWQIAKEMGIHPSTLSIMLRTTLDPDGRQKVQDAIARLAGNLEACRVH